MRIVSVRLSRLGVLGLMVAVALFLLAVPAFAADGQPVQVIPMGWAQVIAFVMGFGVPFGVGLLTRYAAGKIAKSVTATVLLVAAAVAAYLANTGDLPTWKGLATAAGTALLGAGASRTVITGGADTALARATANFGVVGAKLPPESLAVVKSQAKRKP